MTDDLLTAATELVAVLQERHHGRMPDEVQAAYDRVRAILAAVPTDDNIAVTAESEAWLRSTGGLPSGDVTPVELGWKIWERGVTESYGTEPAMHLMWSSADNSWWLEAYDTGGDTLASIELDPRPTRADVRRLFSALSINTR